VFFSLKVPLVSELHLKLSVANAELKRTVVLSPLTRTDLMLSFLSWLAYANPRSLAAAMSKLSYP
jgi:hypothetical protein